DRWQRGQCPNALGPQPGVTEKYSSQACFVLLPMRAAHPCRCALILGSVAARAVSTCLKHAATRAELSEGANMTNPYRPEPPQLLRTAVADGRAPGVYYRIDGELVPVLHIWLDGSVPVFFEHHVVLWKDPALAIGIRGKGALKRVIAGMQIFLTEARGPG